MWVHLIATFLNSESSDSGEDCTLDHQISIYVIHSEPFILESSVILSIKTHIPTINCMKNLIYFNSHSFAVEQCKLVIDTQKRAIFICCLPSSRIKGVNMT